MGRPTSTKASSRIPPNSHPDWPERVKPIEAILAKGGEAGLSWAELNVVRKTKRISCDTFSNAMAWLEQQGRLTCLFERLPPRPGKKDGHARKGDLDKRSIRWVLGAVRTSPGGPTPDP